MDRHRSMVVVESIDQNPSPLILIRQLSPEIETRLS